MELTKRFGGVTSFTRSPAEGRWTGKGSATAEEVVVIEVMVERLDAVWWTDYRKGLEKKFPPGAHHRPGAVGAAALGCV